MHVLLLWFNVDLGVLVVFHYSTALGGLLHLLEGVNILLYGRGRVIRGSYLVMDVSGELLRGLEFLEILGLLYL